MAEPQLVPVFIPALVVLLYGAEQRKGSALTVREVLDIRDKGACVMMPATDVDKLVEKRGYSDLDPEGVWDQWQEARAELGLTESGTRADRENM